MNFLRSIKPIFPVYWTFSDILLIKSFGGEFLNYDDASKKNIFSKLKRIFLPKEKPFKLDWSNMLSSDFAPSGERNN